VNIGGLGLSAIDRGAHIQERRGIFAQSTEYKATLERNRGRPRACSFRTIAL
jgi:hypothetical protein